MLRARDWKALPQNIRRLARACASETLEPKTEDGLAKVWGSGHVSVPALVCRWRAESKLDLKMACNVPGPDSVVQANLPESRLAFACFPWRCRSA